MYREKLTIDIPGVNVRAKAGVCCLELKGNSDPRGRLVDEGHQSLGCQGNIEGEDPDRYRTHKKNQISCPGPES